MASTIAASRRCSPPRGAPRSRWTTGDVLASRCNGRERLSDDAPASEWKAGLDRRRLPQAPARELRHPRRYGRIDKEGGTKGIDSRFFYSRLISDFWDAKAGVPFTVFDQRRDAPTSWRASRGWLHTASMSMPRRASADRRRDGATGGRTTSCCPEADRPALRRGGGRHEGRPCHRSRQRPEPLRGGPATALRDRQGVRALCRRELRAVHRQHGGLCRGGGEPTSKVRALVGVKIWF